MDKYKLDKEEQEILELFKSGALVSVENVEEEKEMAQKSAAEHMKTTAKVNIRLTQHDLEEFKRIAEVEGISYETLMSSILHKYINKTIS